MPEFQNDEQIISYYKKVLLPLESINKIVNKTVNSSFSITLNVKGTMITGLLVALREYRQYASDLLLAGAEEKTDPETIRELRNVLKLMDDIYDNPGLDDLVNSYVCIKSPEFIMEGTRLIYNGHFWLGKMDSVDGLMHIEMGSPHEA
jgi:hypothetical protein